MDIIKGKSIPSLTYRPAQYPIRNLLPGDSFFAAGRNNRQMWSALTRHRRDGKRFITRCVIEDGVKGTWVWRINDDGTIPESIDGKA